MSLKERKHRLDVDLYKGNVTCAFTCCIKNRTPIFINEDIFWTFEKMLRDALSKNRCDAHVYMFMPDHLHLLLDSEWNNGDVRRVVIDFKQKSGYWLSKNQPHLKWQKDFYDHILRKNEDIDKHIRYILENPVRKGIVNDWLRYPYKGSTIHDFQTWL